MPTSRRLDDVDVARALDSLPGWAGDSSALRRSVTFPDFSSAVRCVVDVADVAEHMDHHPDIDVRWRTLHLALTTHSAGGVTQLDVELAHRIDAIASAHGGA